MATNEESQGLNKREAQDLTNAMLGLTDAVIKQDQSKATESLSEGRQISSEIKSKLDVATKDPSIPLEKTDDIVKQINKGLRTADSITRSSYNLAESRNLLLESDAEIEKKIKELKRNQLDLTREQVQIFKLSENEELPKDLQLSLKSLSEAIKDARESSV